MCFLGSQNTLEHKANYNASSVHYKKKKKRFIVLFLEVDQMTMYVLP